MYRTSAKKCWTKLVTHGWTDTHTDKLLEDPCFEGPKGHTTDDKRLNNLEFVDEVKTIFYLNFLLYKTWNHFWINHKIIFRDCMSLIEGKNVLS